MSQHSEKRQGMSDEQASYLQGLAMGLDVARTVRGLPVLSGAADAGTTIQLGPTNSATAAPPPGPEAVHWHAQQRATAGGKALVAEEVAKREKDPFTMWGEMRGNAHRGQYPRGADVFRYKFHGLFYVAPAQDAFMCRLRVPGGELSSSQMRGIAELATRFGGGYVDVTTRANLQIREIAAEHALEVLQGLVDLGIVNRGAGADNVRNITASATSGFDPDELCETLPLAREMHHYILQHRELYGLPRKFNIAFEGGGRISSLHETNDLGFRAVRVLPEADDPPEPQVAFRLELGGITGHLDFARATDVVVAPDQCVDVAAAVLHVFLMHGDRTDRRRARLKYLLDEWGVERLLGEVESRLGSPLRRVAAERLEVPQVEDRWAHVGFHQQQQPDKHYVGVVLPVGRLQSEQVHRLAAIADRFGQSIVRLTVWQNLIIPHIDRDDIQQVQRELEQAGLEWDASSVRSGLVACTGNTGCRFAASNTKGQAMLLAQHLEQRVQLDVPVNIHLTGCHHSCAQHYIGDIGLEATKVEVDSGDDSDPELVEGYHVCVGGGWGERQSMARRILDSVPFHDVPPLVERLLQAYRDQRTGPDESFAEFAARHDSQQLRAMALGQPAARDSSLQEAAKAS